MAMQKRMVLYANKLFKPPVHPFNMQNSGKTTYFKWQYDNAPKTLSYYADKFSPADIFFDKTVLDIGCGCAGKTLYYATLGVKKIVGIDTFSKYKDEAIAWSDNLASVDKFEFLVSDAKNTPFEPETFDTIITNDTFEHLDNPLAVLLECHRILKPKGRIFINFPPYNHPYGAHLSDAIGIPWVHLFADEETLIESYKSLTAALPDYEDRIKLKFSEDQKRIAYINKMTIRKFKNIIEQSSLNQIFYKEIPLRDVLSPFATLPFLNEMLVKMVVCVLTKV